jgi:hypothetical protein
MLNPVQLEEIFRKYSEDIAKWAHDGILDVNLALLNECGLIDKMNEEIDDTDDITQYFHVIESMEKVTLFNEQFAIWIIPKMDLENPTTYVLIALIQKSNTNLELVFQTTGVYNTPRYVLKVLQHFLVDMLETEATVTAFEKNQ